MINVKHSVKTLGVHVSPSLSWNDEFEYVKEKMKSSIKKFMTVEMKLHQVYLYFNTYMLTNVFFGCGIVNFTKKQCDELKKIYELPIIRKMRLGDNFPRKLLYVKKSALGVGLIEPATVIDYLAIKLYVGNKRAKGELTSVINIHEEISQEDSGLPRRARRKQGTIKYWKAGWIEEIDEKLRERKIEIADEEEKDLVTTTNKFLMEYALEYMNEKKDKMKVLKKINSVRKYKGVMLPYELFGENGNQMTTCGRITEERSSLVQKRVAIASKKPAKGSKKAWEDFTQWLRAQNVKTTKDFKAECDWKWLINNHSERLHVKDDNDMYKVYIKVRDNNGQNKYEYEKEEEEIEVQCEGVIGVFVNNKL